MKHICFLHGSSDLYGASRVLLEDAGLLRSLGYSVEVVLPMDGPLADALKQAGTDVSVDHGLRVLRASHRRSLFTWPVIAPKWSRRPDLAIVWTLALAHYVPYLRSIRCPAAVSVHEILESKLGRSVARVAAAAGGPMQVNSMATEAWLASVTSEPLDLAYPSAPTRPSSLQREAADGTRLLLAGRINGHKGHRQAVDLVALLRDLRPDLHCQLTLVGAPFPGQERHSDTLANRVAGLPWVRQLGEVASIEPLLLSHDALLVLPQRPEPFGITPLEAWAVGVRAFGTPLGGAREALRLVDGVCLPVNLLGAAETLSWCIDAGLLDPPSPEAPVASVATANARAASWSRILSVKLRERDT